MFIRPGKVHNDRLIASWNIVDISAKAFIPDPTWTIDMQFLILPSRNGYRDLNRGK
jgi:hypothetical protein